MDEVRKAIRAKLKERGLTMKAVSKDLGKNDAYLQQFLERDIPLQLSEKVRWRLAEILDMDERQLGAPDRKGSRGLGNDDDDGGLVVIPMHDVRASAGSGSLIDTESIIGRWPFPLEYLRHSLSLRSPRLSLIQVIGDSMEPTLKSGDAIMVDLADNNVAQPGIFALYDGAAVVIKRVEKIPSSKPNKLRLISDNPRHTSYDVPAMDVNIAGRVVWFGRGL